MNVWEELKRRNVVRVGVAYVAAAWLLIQSADTLFGVMQLPDWTVRFVVGLVLLGFPIALILSWAYEITPHGLKKSSDVLPEDQVPPSAARRRLDQVIIIVLTLAVVVMALDNYVLEETGAPLFDAGGARDGQPEQAATAADAIASPANGSARTAGTEVAATTLPDSVAVLPFENLSPDEANAFFAIGLHDEILSQLFRLSNLNVISRQSVLRYEDSELSIPEIARELNVRAVMEGTVRYAGDQIRVTVQLIDGTTDQHLWSDTYTERFEDIFAIESDIAMNVANALNAAFTPADREAIERIPTTSSEAYSLYLQARTSMSAGEFDIAVDLLEGAIENDPNFADAIGLLAFIRCFALVNNALGSGLAGEELLEREQEIRTLTARVLELDPSNPDARAALRIIDLRRWRWTAFEAAIEPSDEPRLLAAQQWHFAWKGEPEEAIRIGRLALAHDPNAPGAYLVLGVSQHYAGDYDAADANLREAIEQVPAFTLSRAWLAYNNIVRGNVETALESLRLTEEFLGDDRELAFLPELAYAYARIGQSDDAQRIFAEMQALENPDALGAGGWAMAWLAVGEEARALEQLEIIAARAAQHEPDPGYNAAMNLRMNFLEDPRLEQPAFADVLSRIRGD